MQSSNGNKNILANLNFNCIYQQKLPYLLIIDILALSMLQIMVENHVICVSEGYLLNNYLINSVFHSSIFYFKVGKCKHSGTHLAAKIDMMTISLASLKL